ncbi:hypothetical protein, partial [Clostridium beijerinckii]|uniref:hypothetical protein n=1 Tax=Clostridium beijerinckii TaxID=1520 RepID=UPI001A9A5E0B
DVQIFLTCVRKGRCVKKSTHMKRVRSTIRNLNIVACNFVLCLKSIKLLNFKRQLYKWLSGRSV